MNAMCMGVALGGQKVTSDPLQPDFQVVDTCFTCVLATEPESFARSTKVPNH